MTKIEKYARKYLQNEIRQIQNSSRNAELSELDLFEKAVIYKYSNDGYESLNEMSRRSKGKNLPILGKLLNSTLSKLPNYEGVVYRSANLTKVELKKYEDANKSDSTITEHSFVSSSKSRLIAMEYGGNVLFRILSKTGKEIEKIAKFGIHESSNEREVLFRVNRKFRILEITNQFDYTLITMEEI